MAGFFAFWVRTLHRTAFDYSAKGLTLRASAEALFNAAPIISLARHVAAFNSQNTHVFLEKAIDGQQRLEFAGIHVTARC